MAKWIVIYVCCMLCCKHSLAQVNGQYTLPFSSAGSIRDIVAMPDSGYCLSSAYSQFSNATPPFNDSSNLIRFDKYNTPVWCRNFNNYVIKNITTTAAGDILTAGYTKAAGSGFPYLSVQKCDRNGNVIWRRFLINEPVFEANYSLNYFLKVIELSDRRIVVINGYGSIGTQTITLLDRFGNFVKVIKLNAQPVDVMEGFSNTIIVLFQPVGGFGSPDVFSRSGILEFDLSLNLLQTKKYGTRGGVTFYQCFKDSLSNSYYLCGVFSGTPLSWQGETIVMKMAPSLAATPIQSVRLKKKYRSCLSSVYRFAKNKDGIVAVESGVTNLFGNSTIVTEPSFDSTITKWRATNIALDNNLNLQWAKRHVIASFDPRITIHPSQGYIITQILRLPDRIVYAGNNDVSSGKAAFIYQVDTLGDAGRCLSTPNPIIINNVNVSLADTVINFIRYAPVIRSASGAQSDGIADISYQCVRRQKPVSKFSFNQQPQYGNFPDVVCERSFVSFIDSSWHEPEAWKWIFPPEADLSQVDDTTCYPNIYKVQFTQAGTFPVKLITTNEIGTDTLTKYVTVIDFIPQPDLGVDRTLCPGDSVRLIHNPVPNSTHYFYRVGGAFYSTSDTVFVKLSGTYICVATSACGSKSDTIKISIAARLKAGFSFSINCDSFLVWFRDTSNLNGNTSLLYQWRFLDKNNRVLGTSALQNPTFIYPGTDTVKAMLVVHSPLSCVQADTVTKTIIITTKPVAQFTYTNACGSPSATFTNASNTGAGSTLSSTWLLGDGNSSTAPNPVYTYNNFGTYTAKLVVTNTEGCTSDTAVRTVVIKAKPVANIAYDTNTCAATPVLLRDSSTVAASTIQSFYWNIPALNQTSLQAFIQPVFPTGGNYAVQHSVISSQGCLSDTIRQNIFIESNPVAAITPMPIGCTGEAITFTSNSTIAFGQISNSRWQAGNNPQVNVSGVAPFTYTFPAAGSYTITHQSISSHGCTGNIATRTITIESKPIIDFTNSLLCPGRAVQFTNASTNAAGSIATSQWRTNNGAAITVTGAGDYSYTFSRGGTYTVHLTVITAGGCSSTITRNLLVKLATVSAGNDTIVREGEPFTLSGSGGISYLWQPPTGLSNATAERPIGLLNNSQPYTVQVTTSQGCLGWDTVLVTVLRNLKIPNAFSPNGDGINDEWRIDQLKDYPNASLQLFDRYGQIIYTAKGNSITDWKGTAGGNKPVPVGTYYYIITLNNELNNKPYKGWVMVVR